MVVRRIKRIFPSTESLLREFILNQFEKHKKNPNTNTQDQALFSREKLFVAHLDGITRLKVGDIAEVMKLHYPILRQWKMEEEFKALSDKAANSFATKVSGYMKDRVEKQQQRKKHSPIIPGPEFADAGLYSRKIIEKIAKNYFSSFPSTLDLLECDMDTIITYAESIFRRHYRNVGHVWRREHLIWLINRYVLENTEILFSEDQKIWVNRIMLDEVLNVILNHLKKKE